MAKEDNLKPFTSETGRLAGQKSSKKGSKHISTIVRELMEDLDWDKIPVKNKEDFKKRYGKNGWLAITSVAIGQAATGDRHAREWLRKAGFGDKLTLDLEKDVFDSMELKIKLVRS